MDYSGSVDSPLLGGGPFGTNMKFSSMGWDIVGSLLGHRCHFRRQDPSGGRCEGLCRRVRVSVGLPPPRNHAFRARGRGVGLVQADGLGCVGGWLAWIQAGLQGDTPRTNRGSLFAGENGRPRHRH